MVQTLTKLTKDGGGGGVVKGACMSSLATCEHQRAIQDVFILTQLMYGFWTAMMDKIGAHKVLVKLERSN